MLGELYNMFKYVFDFVDISLAVDLFIRSQLLTNGLFSSTNVDRKFMKIYVFLNSNKKT